MLSLEKRYKSSLFPLEVMISVSMCLFRNDELVKKGRRRNRTLREVRGRIFFL